MRAIAWEPPALAEYADALADSQDPSEFQRKVNEALADIASGLTSHAKVRRTPARRCIFTKPPYSIVYTETDDEIRVWAFPHHKQKPGYWMNRLPRN